MPITLQETFLLIEAAHHRAAELGVQVTVAVVDEGGHLQALGRMDGAPPLSAEVAGHKAAGVALFRRDGTALRELQQEWPAFFEQLDRATRRPILTGAGSMLIRRGDTVLGAIAISGGSPRFDDDCAETALARLGPAA